MAFLEGAAGEASMKLTKLQGQYVAFIFYYTKLNGRPPAERDLEYYFRTTPPAVHDMILRLEKSGAIGREPWAPACSIPTH